MKKLNAYDLWTVEIGPGRCWCSKEPPLFAEAKLGHLDEKSWRQIMLNDSIAMSSNLLVNVLSYNNQLEINRMCWGNNACYSVTANMCSRDNNKCPQLAFGPIQETCIKKYTYFWRLQKLFRSQTAYCWKTAFHTLLSKTLHITHASLLMLKFPLPSSKLPHKSKTTNQKFHAMHTVHISVNCYHYIFR